MASTPQPATNPALARFPADVLEAYQRYRTKGDAGAVEAVVIAAVVDYRPAGPGPAPSVDDATRLVEDLGYDSVAVAELVFFLEDLFDVTLSNDDICACPHDGRPEVLREPEARGQGAARVNPVVTGVGFITPIGNDRASVERSLREGFHGIAPGHLPRQPGPPGQGGRRGQGLRGRLAKLARLVVARGLRHPEGGASRAGAARALCDLRGRPGARLARGFARPTSPRTQAPGSTAPRRGRRCCSTTTSRRCAPSGASAATPWASSARSQARSTSTSPPTTGSPGRSAASSPPAPRRATPSATPSTTCGSGASGAPSSSAPRR
jgi:acyl carrier protein